MEQSIRTQPPGPRRRPPAGAAEAAVPGPATPPDAPPRPAAGSRAASGRATPRPRLRLPLPLRTGDRGRDRPGGGRPARLTAVGTGVLAVAGTLAVAGLDRLLFDGLGTLFGLGYLVVCFQLAVRVRLADLPAAPISGPIAFATALLLLGPVSSPGVTGQVLALATGLALRAGWLFSGTSLAVVIVAARFLAQRRIRRGRANG
ncbi:hypothetical protein GCM10009760_04390 [Kitasatospora kazusensis]|uniref:DUF6542 domain-containing protein n=1 Tax=Kitasatospora kazusensis TaxID=407974 RepID=A0ABP5KEF2_9ACTN